MWKILRRRPPPPITADPDWCTEEQFIAHFAGTRVPVDLRRAAFAVLILEAAELGVERFGPREPIDEVVGEELEWIAEDILRRCRRKMVPGPTEQVWTYANFVLALHRRSESCDSVTLLRPADPAAEALLRPAASQEVPMETLLRPHEEAW